MTPSLASGLAVAVLAPILVALVPVVALWALARSREADRRARLRRRSFGGTSADPL